MKVYINNEIIINKNVTSADVEIDSFIMRFSWSEKAGMVLLDNTYFANFTEEGDEVDTAAPPTENVTLAGNLGTGAFASSGLNFSDVTLDGLKENGRLSSLGTGVADVTFGASGVAYAQIVSIANNPTLKFGSTANGDPMFFIKPENKYTEADKDSYVLDMDFAYGGGTLVSGSDAETAVGGITFNAKPGTKYSILNLTIMYNNQTGKHRLAIGQSYNFGPADAVTPYDINLKEWYNIRVTITDTTDAVNKGTVTVAINGETVLTYQLSNPLTSIGAYDGLDIGLYHRWGCNNSVMYFDNVYFSMVADADVPKSEEPDTPTEPEDPEVPVDPDAPVVDTGTGRGNGVYYEKAQKYEGMTATALNKAGLLTSTGWDGNESGDPWTFDSTTANQRVNIVKIDGGDALSLTKLYKYTPYVIARSSNEAFPMSEIGSRLVLDLDIRFDGLTRSQAGNSGTLLFSVVLDRGYGEKAAPTYKGIYVNQVNATDSSGIFFDTVENPVALKTWYNIRLELETVSGGCNIKKYVDNKLISESVVETIVQIASVEFYNSWTESGGQVYIDNLYLGRPVEGVTPEAPEEPEEPVKPEVPELDVSFAGERGTGVYYESALSFENVTATELKTAELLISTVDTNESYNFDAPNMINPVMVKKLNGDSALEIIKNNNHDPELIVRSEKKSIAISADTDDFVVEFDICFDSLTRGQAGSSGTTLFWMTVDKGFSGSTNPAYRTPGFTVSQTSASEGEPYFAFGGAKAMDFAFDTWYNIRIEYKDVSTENGTCTMFINNVQVGVTPVSTTFALETVASVEFFNSWSETNGKVYLDNFYFGEIKSEE